MDFAQFQSNESGKNESDWSEEAQQLIRSFHGKSERDMMIAIYTKAKEGKRNGTLTNEQIDAFYAQFSPMLDQVKRKKLKKVIEQLKNM